MSGVDEAAVVWAVVLVLAAPTAIWLAIQVLALGFRLERRWRHRAKIREAIRQGWQQPTMPRNWRVLRSGSGLNGVSAVEYDPDPGVPISEFSAHTRRIQREVEAAWLKDLERGRVPHANEVVPAPASPPHPQPPACGANEEKLK